MPITITPAELSLPAKFERFRGPQAEAIERVITSDKRFILLQGPTGSGKTLIVAATNMILKEPMLYLCFTKQLQNQFTDDFEYDLHHKPYAVELKGRANYPTVRYPHLFPRINASLCTSHKEDHCRWCCDGKCGGRRLANGHEECLNSYKCHYKAQKRRALGARIAVLNFDIFANEANYVGAFSNKFKLSVVDEADELEHGLMGFVELNITAKWIDKLQLTFPEKKTVEEAWIAWARDVAYPRIRLELNLIENEYGIQDIRHTEELTRMQHKIEFFLKEMQDEHRKRWVFIPGEDKWSWKPVFISGFADRFLWKHMPGKIILMSATIISPDEMAYNLGIPKQEVEFIDLPSSFPKERRPIYFVPAAAVTKKTEVESRIAVVNTLDRIIDAHPDDKILCHSTSYSFAKVIMQQSKRKDRLISYNGAADRIAALDKLKEGLQPYVLVAPSMERGIDLPGDDCRVVVVCKIPYANLGDRQVAQRLYSDKRGGKLWYAVNTIRTLVQETGRAMRSEDDTCTIYILDSQFSVIYKEYKGLFPKWWREAVHFVPPKQLQEAVK